MLAKWCEITSCNGIIDLYQAKNKKSHFIFWSTIMVLTTVASLFFTYVTIRGYFEKPYVTNVELIQSPTLELPQVLICYQGGLNVTAFDEFGFTKSFVHVFMQVANEVLVNNITAIDAAKELSIYMEKHDVDMLYVYRNFGYKCDDIVSSLNRHFGPVVNHCKEIENIPTTNGNCFAFKNNDVQVNPLPEAGLIFNLTAPKSSYASKYPVQAFEVNVNNEFSITIEKSLGYQQSYRSVDIPVNSKVKIVLKPIFYKRFDNGDKCDGHQVKYHTSNDCFFECYKKELIVSNNCTDLNFVGNDSPDKLKICNPFVASSYNEQRVQSCNKNCLRKCEEWVFETSISYSSFNESLHNRGCSIVYIYYNIMQYTQIEEVPAVTYDMAIANVGGQVGLWLGVSIVTIIQAIYYATLAHFNSIYTRGKTANAEVFVKRESAVTVLDS